MTFIQIIFIFAHFLYFGLDSDSSSSVHTAFRSNALSQLMPAILDSDVGNSKISQVEISRNHHFSDHKTRLYRLGNVRSMSFDVTTWGWGTTKESVKAQHFMKCAQQAVRAVRPSSLRLDVLKTANHMDISPDTTSYTSFTSYDVFASDGKNQYSFTKWMNQYTREKSTHVLTDNYNGGGALIFPDILFSTNPLKKFSFKLKSNSRRDDKHVAIYSYDRKLAPKYGILRYVLYMSLDTKLPTRISQYDTDDSGRLIEINREEYTNWKLNPTFSSSIFNPDPPVDAKPFPNDGKPKVGD